MHAMQLLKHLALDKQLSLECKLMDWCQITEKSEELCPRKMFFSMTFYHSPNEWIKTKMAW